MLRKTFLSILFIPAVFAQTGAIEGTVLGRDGTPVKGAMIRIVRTDAAGRYQVKTDRNGHYFHAGLPLGSFDLTCLINDQDAGTISGVRTELGDPIPIDFDLRTLAKIDEGPLYVSSQNQADRIQLRADGSFSLQEDGQAFTGTYAIAGTNLKLHIVQLKKNVDVAIQGNKLIVNGDEIWVQPN